MHIGLGEGARVRIGRLEWSLFVSLVTVAGCAPPSSTYVAAAASERAAWFVHRDASAREVVDRVIECHEERVPPCVRFEVVGVRDADWYAQWVAQTTRGGDAAPATPSAPSGSTAATTPGATTPSAPATTTPTPTPTPRSTTPAPSAPRPPPAWTP